MNNKWFLILLLVFPIMLLPAITVEEILSNFDETLLLPNIQGSFHVQMISQNGDVREIEARAYQKLMDDNQMNRLFLFDFPPTVRDTGLLLHSFFDGRDNNMWIYLPAIRRVKRIALENSGGGYFMGSDFTYRDLIRKSEGYLEYELTGEGEANGHDCYVVRVTPSSIERQQEMGYSYAINYYRKSDFLLYRVEYFDLAEEYLKAYQVHDELIMGQYIYPTHVTMENFQTGHRSIIQVTDFTTEEIPDRFFTTRYLQNR